MTHRSWLFGLVIAGALLACDSDDSVRTARAQAAVNQQVTADTTVQVVVRHGVANLTGIVVSDAVRERAIAAARSVDGVKDVSDHIQVESPTTITGGTVPR